MNSINIKRLIDEGENEHVEFKIGNTPPEIISRVVCAFLNGSGGRMLLGIGDKGQISGVTDAEEVTKRINSQLPKLISPPAVWTVEQIRLEDRAVIVIDVPAGMDKPYVTGGAIYIRRGEHNKQATRDDISSLIQKRSDANQRWERQIAMGADRLDLDDNLINETARLAVEAERWNGSPNDIEGFLHTHGLFVNGGLTNAAVLLFGKQPSRLIPQARLRLLVMPEGKTGNRYSVDKTFESNLLRIVEEIPSALAAYVGGVASDFKDNKWQREDHLLYPMAALREGVLNALVHRDYSLTGSILISIAPDSLQISNPGGLPPGLTIADLKRDHPSLPRNPDIAHILFLYGLIEKIGRGTQRIVEECRRARLRDPKWQSSEVETKLSFFISAKSTTLEQLNERQQKIVELLKEKKQLRAGDIVRSLGGKITERTIRNDIQALVDGGWLVRRGRGRSTSYVEGPSQRLK